MEVLKLTATTDASGRLTLNIPTSLVAAEVNVVVVLDSASASTGQGPGYDFSDLVGRLAWQGNSVAEQRALRDEW